MLANRHHDASRNGTKPPWSGPVRRLPGAAVAAVVVVLAAAACGGGGSGATAASTTTTTLTRAARTQAYLKCLQSHGVDVTALGGLRGGPNATTTLPPGVTPEQLTAAMQACQSLRPTGGGGGFRNSPAFAAYRNCVNLQLQKVGATTLPPPGSGGGQGGAGGNRGPGSAGGTSTTNPVLQAARQACAALLPPGGFGGGGTDGSTTTPTT